MKIKKFKNCFLLISQIEAVVHIALFFHFHRTVISIGKVSLQKCQYITSKQTDVSVKTEKNFAVHIYTSESVLSPKSMISRNNIQGKKYGPLGQFSHRIYKS